MTDASSVITRRQRQVMGARQVSLLSSLATLVFLYLFSADIIGDEMKNTEVFFALSILVCAYTGVQALQVYRSEGYLFFINPIIQFSLLGNYLLFVVGGSVYIVPQEYGGVPAKINDWMVLWLEFYVLGSVAVWLGYWSRVANGGARMLRRSRLMKRVVRPNLRINTTALWLIFGIAVFSTLGSIWLGIYGYSLDSALASRVVAFKQYITIGRSGLLLVLLVLALAFFAKPAGLRKGDSLYFVLAVCLLFGFLSGFKSQVIIPLIILGLAHYVVHQRVPRWSLPVLLVAIFLAYSVIQPFRETRQTDANFQSTSVTYIFQSMFTPETSNRVNSQNIVSHFLHAQFPVPLWAEGLRYHHEHDGLKSGDPQFARNILLAPVLAFVPRVVWPSKPVSFEGNWFYRKVLGRWGNTSVSISHVTSLYFAGGAIAIFAGFFLFGVIQRVFFFGLVGLGAGGIIVYLGLFSTLRTLGVYHVMLVDLLRYLPIMVLVQFFLLRPGSPGERKRKN